MMMVMILYGFIIINKYLKFLDYYKIIVYKFFFCDLKSKKNQKKIIFSQV